MSMRSHCPRIQFHILTPEDEIETRRQKAFDQVLAQVRMLQDHSTRGMSPCATCAPTLLGALIQGLHALDLLQVSKDPNTSYPSLSVSEAIYKILSISPPPVWSPLHGTKSEHIADGFWQFQVSGAYLLAVQRDERARKLGNTRPSKDLEYSQEPLRPEQFGLINHNYTSQGPPRDTVGGGGRWSGGFRPGQVCWPVLLKKYHFDASNRGRWCSGSIVAWLVFSAITRSSFDLYSSFKSRFSKLV